MGKKTYIVNYPCIQKRSEDIDLKLIGQLEDFLRDKGVIVNEREKTEFIGKINEFKTFLQKFAEDVKVELSSPNDELADDYEKRSKDYMLQIEILEKQRHAYELLRQAFTSVDPFKLSGAYKRFFSLLLRFQEASFKYQESYRDHLIHSLRVFLLVIAIFEILERRWISIFRKFLRNTSKRIGISPKMINRFSDADMWELSIHAASAMSMFHDIGMVPSKYKQMMEGLDKHIFKNSGNEDDLSIFSFGIQTEITRIFENKREETLSTLRKLSKLHPEYDELYSKLEDDLERFEGLSGKEDLLGMEDIHGSLSLVCIYPCSTIKHALLSDDNLDLERDIEENESVMKTLYDEIIIGKPQVDYGRINEKGHPSLGDDLSVYSNEKIKRKVGRLVLHEAMNAIYVHDKKGHLALSPLSEILIFADSSQEWDRIEYKEGEITRYTKRKIEIFRYEHENREIIFGFYEKSRFKGKRKLDDIMSQLKDIFSDTKERGNFGFFVNIQADKESDDIVKPSQALFRSKYHPKIFDFRAEEIRERIPIEDFCRECRNCEKYGKKQKEE